MSRTRFLVLVILLLPAIGLTFGMVGNPFESTGFRPLRLPLAQFPDEIVDADGVVWRGVERELPPKVLRIAGMDRYLRRDYRASDGRTVQFFVSYYGNMRAGIDTIYHNPTVCFPSHGWTAAGHSLETAGAEGEEPPPIPVTLYRFTKGSFEYVVLNFFIVNGRSLAQSPRDDPLELARQKLTFGSDPGYYVQTQVIANSASGRHDGGKTALAFLTAAREHLLAHF